MLSDVRRLREMLREARRWLPYQNSLAGRIDAELEKPLVEWVPDTFWGEGAVEARVDGAHVTVYRTDWADDDVSWSWTVSRPGVTATGETKTKTTAVIEALKTAGMGLDVTLEDVSDAIQIDGKKGPTE